MQIETRVGQTPFGMEQIGWVEFSSGTSRMQANKTCETNLKRYLIAKKAENSKITTTTKKKVEEGLFSY